MANMRFAWSGGTINLTDNPTTYDVMITPIEDNQRSLGGQLINYYGTEYRTFNLFFSYMGTTDEAAMGSMYSAHPTINFFPFDQNRGTANSFQVKWLGNYNLKPIAGNWDSGFSGNVTLEQI